MRQRFGVRLVGWLLVLAGVSIAAIRYAGDVPPARNVESAVGAIAFGAVIAAPGVLALLALQDRPALMLPAAIALLPMSLLSLAGVLLPLVIPSLYLFVTSARSRTGPAWRTLATTIVVFTLLVAAVVALVVHRDPRTWVTATASYSTSDIITYWEAALSLIFTGMAILAGWLVSPVETSSGRRLAGARGTGVRPHRRPLPS